MRQRQAIAYWEALSLAKDLMLQNFVVASYLKHIAREINSRSQLFNCIFSFEGRAANSNASRLAKFLHSFDQGRHVWFVQPHDPFCIPHHVDFEQ